MTRWIAAAALAASLFGCSGSTTENGDNQGPVIDSIDGETNVPLTPGVGWQISFVVKFHDPEGDTLKSGHLKVPAGNIDEQVQPTGTGNAGLDVQITFQPQTPPGSYDLVLSLVDARGAEGASVTKTVTLQ